MLRTRASLLATVLAVALLPAPPTAAWEPQDGLRHERWDSSSGRRADSGVHPNASTERWSVDLPTLSGFSEISADRDGHILVAVQVEGRGLHMAAHDASIGARAWTTDTGQPWAIHSRGLGCTTVAEDGTIWTVTDDDRIMPINPDDGTADADRAIAHPGRVGGCSDYGLALLPGNRLTVASGIDGYGTVVSLTSGGTVRVPTTSGATAEEIEADLLLSSPDGQRLYAMANTDEGPELRSYDPDDGSRLGQITLPGDVMPFRPMEQAYVDRDGGIVLRTAVGASTGEDGHITRILDDGSGGLRIAWTVEAFESSETDAFASSPTRLLPGGREGELVVGKESNLADGWTAIDLETGEGVWAGALAGADGTMRPGRAIVDSGGNIITPVEFGELADGTDVGTYVIGPDGLQVGASTPLIDGQRSALDLLLLEDGTLVMVQDGSPDRLVAIGPGSPVDDFTVPTELRPRRTSSSITPFTLSSSTIISAERLELRGPGGTFAGEINRADLRPTTFSAAVDLRGATPGAYAATAIGPDGSTGVGMIVVEAPDDKAALRVHVHAPGAIRNGLRGGAGKPAQVTVTNQSNRTAVMVPVWIEVGFEPDTDRQAVIDTDMLVPMADGSVVPARPDGFVQGPDAQRALIFIGSVGPYATVTVPLRLRVGADAPPLDHAPVRAVIPRCLYDLMPLDPSSAAAAFAGPSVDPCGGIDFLDPGLSDEERVQAIFPEGSRERELAECLLNIRDEERDRVIITAIRDGEVVQIYNGSQMIGDCYQSLVAFAPVGGVDEAADRLFEAAKQEAENRVMEGLTNWWEGNPECEEDDESDTRTGSAIDPNEVVGRPGSGEPERYITDTRPLDYTIFYENDAEAGFPAQVVTVKTTLDDDVDPATVEVGAVGWGDLVLTPPPAVGSSWTDVISPEGESFAVGVEAGLSGRELTWTMRTLDRTTLTPTDDDLAGFLPPNGTPPEGDGFVSYSVSTGSGVDEGTEIAAQASIVFDVNAPIVTNTWSNTIDRTPPTSVLMAPSGEVRTNSQQIGWEATDGVSGIRQVIVEQQGPTGTWRVLPTAADAMGERQILGDREQTVTVRVRAIDGAGNVEVPGPQGSWSISRDAVERLAGGDRVLTALDVSRTLFPTAPTVVLARQDTYPDSLTGATLADRFGAPLLLTRTSGISDGVIDDIQRLGAGLVIILGGPVAVSEAAVAELEAIGLEVVRLAGANRYATAAAVAQVLAPSPGRVFVAEGAHADEDRGWPEALLAAPWAAQTGDPLLLVEADRLPDETRQALTELGPDHVTVVGAAESVSQAVADQITGLGMTVERVTAEDRYSLSAAVQLAMDAEGIGTPALTVTATGRDFPDALSVGAAVAASGGRLLMLDGQDASASDDALDRITDTQAGIGILGIAGDSAAVSDQVDEAIRGRLR